MAREVVSKGIVAKDLGSRYIPGRTLSWLKVKQNNCRDGDESQTVKLRDKATG